MRLYHPGDHTVLPEDLMEWMEKKGILYEIRFISTWWYSLWRLNTVHFQWEQG